jgi:transketolase
MEGVANEAVSLAGHLGLGKLIVLYDSNDISLDGDTSTSFSDQTIAKFQAIGWHTELVKDGNDVDAIDQAINNAKQVLDKPSLIEIKTIIGFGAPNQGTHKVHGAPIGEEGSIYLRQQLDWPHEPFNIPEHVYDHFKQTVRTRGIMEFTKSEDLLNRYRKAYPELYRELVDALENRITVDLNEVLPKYELGHKDATRNYSFACLNAVKTAVPSLVGGSADLSSSTKAIFKAEPALTRDQTGRNIMFGVREFAMAAIANGMALHAGIRPFVSTFFVFSDYLKPALRLSALMNLPTLFIFTHDSIAVGEDGPTHEPIEQLAMLRSIPNVQVLRPADGNETAAAYKLALETTDQPTVLVLTRQAVPVISKPHQGLAQGAYVVSEAKGEMDGILIASGSEVSLAISAQLALETEGIQVRVVSMPSMEIFVKQDKAYKATVLPEQMRKRLSIEMGSTFGWHQFVGLDGKALGIDTFGASGPAHEVLTKFGFTVENVVQQYKNLK